MGDQEMVRTLVISGCFFIDMKYSNEITEEICKYLRAGNNQHDSAILSGLAEATFYDWQREKESNGEANPNYHVEFVEAIKKAEQECKARNIAIIQKAGEKSWQASAWYLERKYHNEFALKIVTQLVGPDEREIEIKIVKDINN